MLIVIILLVIVAAVGLAYAGQRMGANMEAPNLGAGTTEQEMRSALSPSVLGAMLGILPFVIFVIALIWTATHLPPEHVDDGSGSSSSAPH